MSRGLGDVYKRQGFLITGSSALLAESVHSVADASNQGLLVLGGRRARRQPTPLHPFGYGRARYFWAFVVAVVLFTLGGVFSLYEGYHKVSDPHELTSPVVAFAILGLAIVFEAFALRTAVKHAQPLREGRSWWRYIRTSRSPELPVLLLEDTGALVGLVFATVGIALALVTGDPVWDGVGTLAIGALLLVIAVVVAIEMKSSLIGEAADAETIERITAELEASPRVRSVIHLITQHLGPDDLLVAAKVDFGPSLTTDLLAQEIDACEARIRAAVPIARVVYIEPDLRRTDAAAPATG